MLKICLLHMHHKTQICICMCACVFVYISVLKNSSDAYYKLIIEKKYDFASRRDVFSLEELLYNSNLYFNYKY